MVIEKAQRKNVKIKLGLQGSSGSGKSYSALLLAFGITNDWTKIVVIDTENGSIQLYSHLGNFNVLSLTPPFSPERYIEAISLCEKSGTEVIIIDSISHEWEFILESHSKMTGNSYINWAKFNSRHQDFVNAILQSNQHIICTLRAKQDYVLTPNKDGKLIPEKVGMKPIQRDGVDYELTIVFEINIKHFAKASKDRTGLFGGIPDFVISQNTGIEISKWCNVAQNTILFEDSKDTSVVLLINSCKTGEELRALFNNSTKEVQNSFNAEFNNRRIELSDLKKQMSNTQNYSKNGN
ncbi:MAG: AAA family ATPase [Leadbetterella sp.]|nr:AAA family ATPase [Leadbetterella sp.]